MKLYTSDSFGKQVLVRCANCGSTDVDKALPGYDIGQGLIGLLLAGPLGLGVGIDNDVVTRVMCCKCGHKWDPRKPDIVVKSR